MDSKKGRRWRVGVARCQPGGASTRCDPLKRANLGQPPSLHIKVVNFVAEVAVVPLARHLDWGYVDAAPLVALYARAALLLGGSLTAVRILPALAGTFGRIGFYANSPRSFEPTLPRYRDPQLGSHRF